MTCTPATYVAGSASSQGPDAPSRRRLASTEASTALRASSTRFGAPVEPDVSTTIGGGSSAADSHVTERRDDLARRTGDGQRELTRRTLVVVGRMPPDAHSDAALARLADPRHSACPEALAPVDPVRDRRGRVHHRQRGLLHPDRRPVRRAGGPRHHRRRGRVVPVRGPARQGGRPDRPEADVVDRRVRRRRAVRRVALRGRLRDVPRDDGRAPDRGDGRSLGPGGVHARRVPARRTRPLARLHAGGAEHRLHRGCPHRWRGAGLQQRRHRPRRAAVHRGGAGRSTPSTSPASPTPSTTRRRSRRTSCSTRARCATAGSCR